MEGRDLLLPQVQPKLLTSLDNVYENWFSSELSAKFCSRSFIDIYIHLEKYNNYPEKSYAYYDDPIGLSFTSHQTLCYPFILLRNTYTYYLQPHFRLICVGVVPNKFICANWPAWTLHCCLNILLILFIGIKIITLCGVRSCRFYLHNGLNLVFISTTYSIVVVLVPQ